MDKETVLTTETSIKGNVLQWKQIMRLDVREMGKKIIIDMHHFVTTGVITGTMFTCSKSRSFVNCKQHFKFCPLCGDSLTSTGCETRPWFLQLHFWMS
jgi:NADH pyrophosphatase NudC (nudix superfamily)